MFIETKNLFTGTIFVDCVVINLIDTYFDKLKYPEMCTGLKDIFHCSTDIVFCQTLDSISHINDWHVMTCYDIDGSSCASCYMMVIYHHNAIYAFRNILTNLQTYFSKYVTYHILSLNQLN